MALDLATAADQANQLLSSAVGILSQDVKTPVYSGVDTSQVKRDAANVRTSANATKDVIESSTTNYDAATTREKEGMDAEAKATGDKAFADNARAEEVARNNRIMNDVYGVSNTGDTSSAIAMIGANQRYESGKANKMLESIQAKQSITLFDDPLGFINNIFTLPQEIDVYNRQVDKVNNLDATIKNAVTNSEQAAIRANAGIPTITAASAKADADKAVAMATQKKALADERLATMNIEFATQKFARDLSIFTVNKDSTAFEIQQAETKFRQQIESVRIAENRAQRLMAAAKLVDEWGQNAALDVALKQFDTNTGRLPGTTNRYSFNKMPSAMREEYMAIAAGSYGADPLESLSTIKKVGVGPNMSPDAKSMFSWLNQQVNAIEIDPALAAVRSNKEQFRAAVTTRLNDKLKEAVASASDVASPFHELSPAKMMGIPDLIPVDSPMAKALEPLTKFQGQMKPEIVVENIATAFRNPTETGAAVAQYYKMNMEQRNKLIPSGSIGIAVPKSYVVYLPGFLSSTPFDLTNPAQATQYVVAKRAMDLRNMGQGSAGSMFPPSFAGSSSGLDKTSLGQ